MLTRNLEVELAAAREELTSVKAQLKAKADELRTSYDYANTIVDTVREPFLVLDQNLVVQYANRSFYEKFAVTPDKAQNHLVYELGNNQWNSATMRTLLEKVLLKNHKIENFLVEHAFPIIGVRSFLLNARHLTMPGEAPARILLAFEEITELEGEKQLKRNAETFSRLVDDSPFSKVKPLIGRDFTEAIHIL